MTLCANGALCTAGQSVAGFGDDGRIMNILPVGPRRKSAESWGFSLYMSGGAGCERRVESQSRCGGFYKAGLAVTVANVVGKDRVPHPCK